MYLFFFGTNHVLFQSSITLQTRAFSFYTKFHRVLVNNTIISNSSICYKTSVWTNFRVRVSRQKQDSSYYQSTTEEEHMTWKSCDRVQNGLEGSRGVQIRVRVRDDVKGQWFFMVMEINEYDIRAHGYGMVALKQKHGGQT